MNRWGKVAWDHFLELYYSDECGEAGVQLLPLYQLFTAEQEVITPSWADIVFNFTHLSADEVKKLRLPGNFNKAWTFNTLVIEQKYYLSWMMKRLEILGVKFKQRKVASLDEFVDQGYDAVINCAGLGSYELIKDDKSQMYPIRGQVLRIKAPWIKNVWFFGTSYLIPNIDSVVVGGTAQKGDWNTVPSIQDTEKIMNDVCTLFPSLRNAPVESVWAGLRPGRTPLRLETEIYKSSLPVIHNYGHGGSGVTIAMGCAQDVVYKHLVPVLQAVGKLGLRSKM